MYHVDKNHVLGPEAAREDNVPVSLDGSRQDILGLLRLKRGTPGLKFCKLFGLAAHCHG